MNKFLNSDHNKIINNCMNISKQMRECLGNMMSVHMTRVVRESMKMTSERKDFSKQKEIEMMIKEVNLMINCLWDFKNYRTEIDLENLLTVMVRVIGMRFHLINDSFSDMMMTKSEMNYLSLNLIHVKHMIIPSSENTEIYYKSYRIKHITMNIEEYKPRMIEEILSYLILSVKNRHLVVSALWILF
jgi:hypothetical protein